MSPEAWRGAGATELTGENGNRSCAGAVHHNAGGLRYLLPRPAEIPQRFGDDQPGVVRQLMEQGVVRVLGAKGRDVGTVEERPGVALAGVAERPRGVAVGRCHRHLDRVFDAVAPSDVFDESNRGSDGRAGVLFQAEGEREVEEQFRVRRSLDLGIEAGLDGHGQVTLHLRESP